MELGEVGATGGIPKVLVQCGEKRCGSSLSWSTPLEGLFHGTWVQGKCCEKPSWCILTQQPQTSLLGHGAWQSHVPEQGATFGR